MVTTRIKITDKVKSAILIGIYLLMILWLGSCQQPGEEIEPPKAEEGFTRNSPLGEYVYGISLLDGSEDNIIDNESNLIVDLPVDVTVKGNDYKITSSSDLAPIHEAYALNPYYPDFLTIQYPIRIKKYDYTEVTISNEEELDQVISSIHDDILYNDVECVDFAYPISIATYDLQNQIADTKEISDDESLFKAFKNIDDEDLIDFIYPINILIDGSPLEILDNVELQNAVEGKLSVCDEEDKIFYNDNLVLSPIKLILTDAPFPFDEIEEANVTINRIDVKTGVENDSVAFITLFNDTTTYNLLELTNGVTADLVDLEIPEGSYQFFRVYVENGNVLLKDGRSFDLKVPSGNASGLLIMPKNPIIISENSLNEYLFDFDLSQSFIPKGNPNDMAQINGFNFKPVIRVTNTALTGTLEGKVTNESNLPLEGVQITVFASDTINTTTFSGPAGNYKILGLLPGEYFIEAELINYQIYHSDVIQIETGINEEKNIELSNE